MNPLVGYYDSPDQPRDKPAYDPPHEGPCVVCYKPLTPDTVRTVSIMAMPDTHPERCYFYRLHRACHDSLTPEEQGALDDGILRHDRPSDPRLDLVFADEPMVCDKFTSWARPCVLPRGHKGQHSTTKPRALAQPEERAVCSRCGSEKRVYTRHPSEASYSYRPCPKCSGGECEGAHLHKYHVGEVCRFCEVVVSAQPEDRP